LLDEITSRCHAAHEEAQSEETTMPGLENFYAQYLALEKATEVDEEALDRTRWRLLCSAESHCDTALQEIRVALGKLNELESKRREVEETTTSLDSRCEQLVKSKNALDQAADEMKEKVRFLDNAAVVSRALERADVDFEDVFNRVDESVSFLQSHFDYFQAKAYLVQFENLRSQALISLRTRVAHHLDKTSRTVEEQVRVAEATANRLETSVLYAQFRSGARAVRDFNDILARRAPQRAYVVCLDEIEAYYTQTRLRLLAKPLQRHSEGLLERQELAPASRQLCSYVLSLGMLERQVFQDHFPAEPAPSHGLLQNLGNTLYGLLRPRIIASDDVDTLREIAESLSMDILTPHADRLELAPLLAVLFRLYQDVQERLIFKTENFLRDSVRGYVVQQSEVDYPGIFLRRRGKTAWFPTVERTLKCLRKIYRVLEMPTFEGIAYGAVNTCVLSLRRASRAVAAGTIQIDSAEPPSTFDSLLFLIMHLLLLREEVSAFGCDLVAREQFVDFSSAFCKKVGDKPDGVAGLLSYLTPKIKSSARDMKHEVEMELQQTCESLTAKACATIMEPFVLGDPVAAETVRKQLPEHIPRLGARINLYLRDSEDTASSVAAVICRPIATAVADAWSREAPEGSAGPDEIQAEVRRLFEETFAISDIRQLASLIGLDPAQVEDDVVVPILNTSSCAPVGDAPRANPEHVELTPTKGNAGAEEPADATDRWYAGDDKTPTGTQS
jgi:hypothetical protein